MRNRGISLFLNILIATTISLTLLSGCEKDMQHPVPNVHVDFRINLEITYELNTIGGWVYFSGGYRGIVIYRLSEDEFRAFDRACTYDVYNRIVVDDPPIARCEECESTYLLIDGSVVEGPARYPLKQYRTTYHPPFVYVSN